MRQIRIFLGVLNRGVEIGSFQRLAFVFGAPRGLVASNSRDVPRGSAKWPRAQRRVFPKLDFRNRVQATVPVQFLYASRRSAPTYAASPTYMLM